MFDIPSMDRGLEAQLKTAMQCDDYEELRRALRGSNAADSLRAAARRNVAGEVESLSKGRWQLMMSVLLLALKDGDAEVANGILHHESGLVDFPNVDKAAVSGSHISTLDCLLAHNWNVNGCLDHQGSVLGYAIRFGQPQAVRWLLEHGASADVSEGSDPAASSPLEIACLYGASADVVRWLIQKGAPVDGSRALCLAAAENNIETLKVLVEEGKADVNLVSEESRTALHAAAQEGALRAVEFLLQKGARRDVLDENGMRPEAVAREARQWSCADLLREPG